MLRILPEDTSEISLSSLDFNQPINQPLNTATVTRDLDHHKPPSSLSTNSTAVKPSYQWTPLSFHARCSRKKSPVQTSKSGMENVECGICFCLLLVLRIACRLLVHVDIANHSTASFFIPCRCERRQTQMQMEMER